MSTLEQMFSVRGLAAVVTGAASGIGLAYAEVMAEHGAKVTLLDLNNAISNMLLVSSNQSNGVAELLPTNPNPTLLEVAQKLDELILALRR